MKYNGILIVGDINCNWGELKNQLCLLKQFASQRIVGNNNCSGVFYINETYFSAIDDHKFLLKWKTAENTYAIFEEEYREKLLQHRIPLIFLPRHMFDDFMDVVVSSNLNFMSVYIYCLKENLDKKARKNSQKDMELMNKCIYSINNNIPSNSSMLIEKLWQLQGTGGGLSRDLIKNMIQCDMLVEEGKLDNISNASYDLCLGDEYYYGGKINRLSNKEPFIAIEPYDYVIASCNEKIIMPRDVSARFDVSVNLFCQGIILSNSTQVDPGFRGKLFCLLFNTSNKVVYLKRRMHYATLEFNKLVEPTTAYKGKYIDEDSIVPYLPPNIMLGAMNELKKEIEKLQTENQKMQSIYLSVLAIFLTIISIILVLK